MKPKLFLQIITLFFILSSCAPRYIQVLNTCSTTTQLKNDFYVYETDTLLIKYYFWAEKGIFAFSVFNKLDKPLFIDWKNSSFIYNDDKLDYWNENETYYTTGIYKGLSYHGKLIEPGYTANAGTNESKTQKIKPERITFIPPKSNYYRSSFNLIQHNHYWRDLNDTIVTRKDRPKEKTKMYVKNYSRDSSPIRFRNYLSLSFDENFQHVFRFDNEFFVSSIINVDYEYFLGKSVSPSNKYQFIYQYPFKNNTSFFIPVTNQ
jgi:hypothetical protein